MWHFAIVLLLHLLTDLTDTCSSNGICGLQPNCYGSYPGYGTYPSGGAGGGGGCGGGCQSSYSCGNYGCHKQRECARGSKTYSPAKERLAKMQAARRLSMESGKPISELQNLEFASETAALIKRNPAVRLEEQQKKE